MYCFIAGNAEAKFKFEKYNETPVFFSLKLWPKSDSIIDHKKFTLINVRPYPFIDHPVKQGDYKADIIIQNQ
jgi:hypothetical protein